MQQKVIGRQKDCWLLTVQHEDTGETRTLVTRKHPADWLNDALKDYAERYALLCAVPISHKQYEQMADAFVYEDEKGEPAPCLRGMQ